MTPADSPMPPAPAEATSAPPGNAAPTGTGAAKEPRASRPAAPEPVYIALEDWLTDYFLPTFRRTLGGEYRWCHQWWQHSEAISRLTALWHSWEVLRLQPGTGIANWYRDHLDHQLPILMGARGPFCQCSETAHREPREAAAAPAPEGWWDTGAYDSDSDAGTAAGPGRADSPGASDDNA
jgi:Domain of unknown function (DUF4913)